jgi:hypothetical protein
MASRFTSGGCREPQAKITAGPCPPSDSQASVSGVFGSYHRDDDQGDLANLRLRKVPQLAHMTQGLFDGDLVHVSTVRTFSRASITIWSMKSSTTS